MNTQIWIVRALVVLPQGREPLIRARAKVPIQNNMYGRRLPFRKRNRANLSKKERRKTPYRSGARKFEGDGKN